MKHPGQDSNLHKSVNSAMCYHYTTEVKCSRQGFEPSLIRLASVPWSNTIRKSQFQKSRQTH